MLPNSQFQRSSTLVIFHPEKSIFQSGEYRHLIFKLIPHLLHQQSPTLAFLGFHSCFTLCLFSLCPHSDLSKEVQESIKDPSTSAHCFSTDVPSQLKYCLIETKTECVKLLVEFLTLGFKPQLSTICSMRMLIFPLAL